MSREIVNTCGICGNAVRSEVDLNWHPRKSASRAHRDMQNHLMTHSLAELLRYEIRQDLQQVPEDQRASIVRDVYRGLLGVTRDGQFYLGYRDSQGVYTIDDALGDIDVYRLWRRANACGDPHCRQHRQ